MEISSYEQERLQRLAENRRQLEELIGKKIEDPQAPPPPKRANVKKKREKKVINPQSRRSSGRLAGTATELVSLGDGGRVEKEIDVGVSEVVDDEDFVVSDDETEFMLNRKRTAPTGPDRRGKHKVEVRGGRTYDNWYGSSCHQCRQKTIDPKVQCTKIIEVKDHNGEVVDSFRCSLMLDGLCLSGRYGEKLEEAVASGTWICPMCRGICNCSFCMQRRGKLPTGQLKQTALAKGFAGVSQYLEATGQLRVKRKLSEVDDGSTAVTTPTLGTGPAGGTPAEDESGNRDGEVDGAVVMEKIKAAKRIFPTDDDGEDELEVIIDAESPESVVAPAAEPPTDESNDEGESSSSPVQRKRGRPKRNGTPKPAVLVSRSQKGAGH